MTNIQCMPACVNRCMQQKLIEALLYLTRSRADLLYGNIFVFSFPVPKTDEGLECVVGFSLAVDGDRRQLE